MRTTEDQDHKINLTLFAGGRGAGTIATALTAHSQIRLTLLVNAYDDGLSTGRLREFIPGMLGPSDIRKNFSRLIAAGTPEADALKFLLEYRFPDGSPTQSVLSVLRNIERLDPPQKGDEISQRYNQLALGEVRELSQMTKAFLAYYEKRRSESPGAEPFDFGDCSLGNIFFAGCYLQSNQDFNEAIRKFTRLHPIPATILNVTQGEGLVLVAIKEDGLILKREAEIVDHQSRTRIAQLFLLPRYLDSRELELLQGKSLSEKSAWLRARSVHPQMNPEAAEALAKAHLIIYGPGTQHSSLFPSYLTKGLAEVIASNTGAEKVFIGNTRLDHEIQSETVDSLVDKLVNYMNDDGGKFFPPNLLVSRCFLQTEDGSAGAEHAVPRRNAGKPPLSASTVEINWETTPGVHLGGKVAEEIISIVNERAKEELRPMPYMVSIIVPGLDEARTVSRVLTELRALDTAPLGIAKEIIFVDGGSTDGTYEQAQKVRGIRTFQLDRCRGRGHAMRFGLEQAMGNLIIFFPSDNEYDPRDLLDIIPMLMKHEFGAVFGSRSIKCVNYPERIRGIYGNDYFGYWLGNYGGKILSIASLILYNRFVTDPLTGIKGFHKKLLTSLGLTANSLDLRHANHRQTGASAGVYFGSPGGLFPPQKG